MARVAVILGLAATAFGYWGTYTASGQSRFDEMAGMIPFFAMIAGAAAAIIASLALVYLRRKPDR